MITVVDQVSPWLMPSRTLAAMIHPHDGAHINSSGTGSPMSQPGDEDRLATEAVRQRAGEEVGGRLHRAERHDERERAGERGEPEDLLGQQRQDRAFLADHPADQRVDADEQQELGEVLPQPEPDRPRRSGRRRPGAGHTLVSDTAPSRADQAVERRTRARGHKGLLLHPRRHRRGRHGISSALWLKNQAKDGSGRRHGDAAAAGPGAGRPNPPPDLPVPRREGAARGRRRTDDGVRPQSQRDPPAPGQARGGRAGRGSQGRFDRAGPASAPLLGSPRDGQPLGGRRSLRAALDPARRGHPHG